MYCWFNLIELLNKEQLIHITQHNLNRKAKEEEKAEK